MDGERGTLIVFLGVFLVATGAFSIISSLVRIHNFQEGKTPSSVLETKFFKWSAPTGLSYGIVAIMMVAGLIYFDRLSEIKIQNLLKMEPNEIARDSNGRYSFDYQAACSIISHSVIVAVDPSGSGRKLAFRGINGVSPDPRGPFTSYNIEVKPGDQFFIRRHIGDIWGINIIAVYPKFVLEAFPLSSVK